MERLYVIIENPKTEAQKISTFDDYYKTVKSLQKKIEDYMDDHSFPEEKIKDAVLVMKEAMNNLIHHTPEYQPVFALIELSVSDNGVEIIVEDREPGRIEIKNQDGFSETGRGYLIMNALSDVKILANQHEFHRIAISLKS